MIASVVIPAFNASHTLDRAIASVLAQSVGDIEVIVVDDGSDDPVEGVDGLDKRVRLIRQANKGVAVARNVGVLAARSELIAFLDADDEWLPRKLEAQLQTVEEHPGAPFWCTGFYWVRDGEELPSNLHALSYRRLLAREFVMFGSLMTLRSKYLAVGGHNPLLTHAEDFDLELRLAMMGGTPQITTERLVKYHLSDGGASSDYRSIVRAGEWVLDAHQRLAREHHDIESLSAIEEGRRRGREVAAYQAVDAARAHLRGAPARVPRDIASAMRYDARVVTRSLLKAARARSHRLFKPA